MCELVIQTVEPANNDKGGSGIGYDMIIGHGLMVQLSLTADFKRQVLQ